ncbi:TonB-dependent receptor family protein [Methyloradius palustris]|uniref:TonB-dependent receptor n=1 Tax=Methyloradius palustris TaxID=2778876 RepID=A0A8D5GC15_9PROT|nr:TonB-dependent receptor [Methyloradius palustris]BCM24708.1 TonB-dependent receptor [Methyloradius palustris]
MQFKIHMLCAAVAATFTHQVCAAETNNNEALVLPVVNVTDQYLPAPSSITQPDIKKAVKEINKTAGGVTVVDAEQYREGRVSTFTDTLGLAPGVFIQSRFGTEESRLSIRGSGLQRNFHGLGIKLMQDGIPVNQADGSFDFPSIDPLSTQYVEVFRGANALQYGASNLGGAINFISPTGYTAPKFEVRTEAGSFGYYKLGLSTAGVVDALDYYVSASSGGQNGFRHNADQSAQRLNANLGYKINDNAETRFYLGYVTNDSDLPGQLTKAELQQNPRQSQYQANPFDPALQGTGQWKRNIDLWRIANKTTFKFDNTTLELGAYYANKDLYHPIVDLFYYSPFITSTVGVIDQHNDDYGLTARLKHQNTLFGLKNEIIAGISPTYGETDDKRFRNIQGQRGALTNHYAQTASNIEMYTEDRLSLTSDLTLIAGLQYARSKRETKDLFITSTGDESYSQTYTQTNPKLGVLYQLQPKIQLFANVSRSFAPPDFGDLTTPAMAKTLKAQKGTTYEIGSRGNSQYVDWDVAVYHARLQNELLGVSPTPGVTDTINAGNTIHTGLEMGLRWA